jgi:hypothetical protein
MAMNKTLYIQDEDGPIWDKARELTGDKLSNFVMEKLRTFVAEEESKKGGYGRILVHLYEDGMPAVKAFYGRWIIDPSQPFDHWPRVYAVAQTQKGNYVVLRFLKLEQGTGEKPAFLQATLSVIESLYDAPSEIPKQVVAEAIKRLGVVVQELDI